ncbi:hypothetical protein G4Y73_03260 [Wenzhouxiangella sp. XN201]|uniref:hypothetical protein n=1 Tax=Wenzhouxiangella sp. XN201 TaxID=2710755 RepID=UPI0013CA2CB3|nr:hypothetical protein [Wenzhouxiangella sp. XN201]NEZ03167.1 hypothetical protein [Wenzhouxiangella sp. XN201]
MIMKWMTNSRKLLFAGAALAASFGLVLSAQAQTCTTTNWLGGQTGSPTVGKQDGDNRRYGGPCGMRVALNGTAHYVTDDTPNAEETYIARFYVFLENPGTGPINLFAADDGAGNDVIEVVFENGAITLYVEDQSGTPHAIPAGGVAVGNGWHSVEFAWEQLGSAQISLNVDGAGEQTATVDTTGITIANAHLGNLNGAAGGGLVDFDDFDSRRSSKPGRLTVGDANADAAMGVGDLVAILSEMNEQSFAAGQPDCNEDGNVAVGDLVCVLDILNSL